MNTMSLDTQYSQRSPGVKRLMREARELAEPTDEFYACPLDDNLFEWHFTVRGPPGTEFDGGFYHGRILLPSQYPMQPPNIILLTPNGRFEVNKKICLSISGHHPETWQPSWSIRTALLALIAFMPTPAAGTIGSLDYTAEERQSLAKKSRNWECPICGKISTKLALETRSGHKLTEEESCLIEHIALKAEEESTKKPVNTELTATTEAATVNCILTSPNVRQRTNLQSESEQQSEVVTDTVVPSTDERNFNDKLWTSLVWFIICLITLLLIRRFFFL